MLPDKYDSSKFADIEDSIEHAKDNKLVLSNVSEWINFKDIFINAGRTVFEKYENVLKGHLLTMEIEESDFYNPRGISEEVYGTPDLWYLVLLVNDMRSSFDFKEKEIYYFDPDRLDILNKIIIDNKDKIEKSKREPEKIEGSTIKKINV